MITKETIIADVLDQYPETAQVFVDIGMHCLYCPSARGESIEEACAVHGQDPDRLIEKINEIIGK